MKSRGIMTMSTTVIVCLAVLSLPVTTNPEPKSPTIEEDIMRMLEISRSGDVAIQILDQLIPTFEKLCSNAPESTWDNFKAEIDMNELFELIIPIYVKFYTQEEIQEIIKFYESPIGKKMIEVMPDMLGERMKAGQEWGRRISERLIKKLEEVEDK